MDDVEHTCSGGDKAAFKKDQETTSSIGDFCLIHRHRRHVHTISRACDDATHKELTESSVWSATLLERSDLDDDTDDDKEATKNARFLTT